MNNPADKILASGSAVARDSSAIDNHRARSALSQAVRRLRWPGKIVEDKVKDENGEEIEGKYKIEVGGFDEPLDGYVTRVDETYKKGEIVEVNVDEDGVAWILSPSLPRAQGFSLCLMIIDNKKPGTWGVSYPRLVTASSFGLES